MRSHQPAVRSAAKLIRVIVADDHRLILEAVRATFSVEGDIEVVATTHRATEVVPLVARHRPDVVLLDVRMPEIDGWTCLDRIKRRQPDVNVVLFSALPEADLVEAARERGAAAVVGKGIDPAQLADLVRQVAAGTSPEPCGFRASVPAADYGLSPRELSILGALARGRSNRQIAQELCIAEQTVKFHLTHVYDKLNLPSRTAAVRYAYEKGLVERSLVPA